jgi:hypothetical protein
MIKKDINLIVTHFEFAIFICDSALLMKTYVITDLTYKLLNPYNFIHLLAKNDDMIVNHIIDYYFILL